jgi:hypothetical protein
MKSILAGSLIFTIALFSGSVAAAQELDGSAVKDLALQGIWDAQERGYGYWSWNEDGSVCLRKNDPTGDCDDTGTWAIEGNFICYELEWWGESEGLRVACISVIAHEGKPYEFIFQGDAMNSTLFTFKLLE